MVRCLLILALLAHPALGVVCAAENGRQAIELPAACCCGPQACTSCGCVDEAPDPAPRPAPAPDQRAPLLLMLAARATVALDDPGGPVARCAPPVAARPERTNNERQAILCVWRT